MKPFSGEKSCCTSTLFAHFLCRRSHTPAFHTNKDVERKSGCPNCIKLLCTTFAGHPMRKTSQPNIIILGTHYFCRCRSWQKQMRHNFVLIAARTCLASDNPSIKGAKEHTGSTSVFPLENLSLGLRHDALMYLSAPKSPKAKL